MPRVHAFNLLFNIRRVRDFNTMIGDSRRSNRNIHINRALRKSAELYRKFLVERYIRFAAGGGDWARLKKSTKERKARRTPGSENLILRETDTILRSIRIKKIGMSWTVGVFSRRKHPHSKKSIVGLVNIHQRNRYPGHPSRPRRIIVSPTRSIRRRIQSQVNIGVNNAVRQFNRGR